MTDKVSLFKLSGLPDSFGVVLLVFSFILLLAPYFSGADFGVFKIPTFTIEAKRWLKIIGPILFITCTLSFIPLIQANNSTRADLRDGTKATPTPTNTVEAAPSPSVTTANNSSSGPTDTSRQSSNTIEQLIALQIALGNPSDATSAPANRTNYLIQRPQYALSYNEPLGRPNWVSWHLSRRDVGLVSGARTYFIDGALPNEFQRITPEDYRSSGYDRGQNCPSKDRSSNQKDWNATFLMTNITPVAPASNQSVWADFENYCREFLSQNKEVYIICGSSGDEGKIAQGRITIPAFLWKIVVVLPDGDNDLARIDETTKVIAIRIPNKSMLRDRNWQTFRVSVKALEAELGYQFLKNVPQPIQNTLKSRVENN